MALVVLISSASAGFRGCQKWNKCKGCSNSVRSASTVMCSWAFKNFSFELDGLLSMSAMCVPIVPSEKELLVQGRYPGCTVAEVLNSIFPPSQKTAFLNCLCFELALWLFMACHQRCAACLLPVFLTLWFRARSDTFLHTLRHTQRHKRSRVHTHTIRYTQTLVCVCVCDWVWLGVYLSVQSSCECVWSGCREEGTDGCS